MPAAGSHGKQSSRYVGNCQEHTCNKTAKGITNEQISISGCASSRRSPEVIHRMSPEVIHNSPIHSSPRRDPKTIKDPRLQDNHQLKDRMYNIDNNITNNHHMHIHSNPSLNNLNAHVPDCQHNIYVSTLNRDFKGKSKDTVKFNTLRS